MYLRPSNLPYGKRQMSRKRATVTRLINSLPTLRIPIKDMLQRFVCQLSSLPTMHTSKIDIFEVYII